MPVQSVSDAAQDILRPYRGTKDAELITFKGKGHDYGLFVAESKNVIERALAAGCALQSLFVEAHWATHERELMECVAARYPDVPQVIATHEEFRQVTGYETTRGALACFARLAPLDPAVLLKDAHRVAILEDITNYTNIGAIFRSAAALNIDAVLLTPSCHDPLFRRASRVSMGTVFQVPWARIGRKSDWAEDGCALLRAHGFKTAALALVDDSLSLEDPALKECNRLALVLGTEGDGLRQSTIATCDYTVKIPMRESVDSLNVAAASAVAFWELRVR